MKKFLKYIILITISFLLFPSVNAEETNTSCKIEDGTAEILLDYFNDVRKVTKNITKQLTLDNKSSKIKKDINRLQENIIKGYNQIISWDGYFSTFNYYLILPISTEIPYEVKRDHNLINKEIKYLNKYFQKIIQRGYSDIKIKDICTGIIHSNNCNLNNKTARDIIIELVKNTSKIGDLYRLSISDKKNKFKGSFILVDKNNFKSELTNYYQPSTLSDCSRNKEGFMTRVNESIRQISKNFKGGDKAIQRWKDALALAQGIEIEDQKQEERKILIQELSRQGISGDNANTILGNSKRYNENSKNIGQQIAYSADNNFLTNTFSSFLKSISNQTNEFNEAVLQTNKPSSDRPAKDKISISSLTETKKKISISQNLKTRIAILYQKELPFAQAQDNNTQALQTRIILMHYELSQVANKLDKTIAISQELCNKQAAGQGNCGR